MGGRDSGGVFFIGQGDADASLTAARVGGKASGLARLDRLGFAVPPALAIGADVCRDYFQAGRLSARFRPHLEAALHHLEDATGLALGPTGTLLLAVRSSPEISMPGMLATVANVGLSDANVRALIRRTGDARLAWNAYRQLVRAFARSVRGAADAPFNELDATHLARAHACRLDELNALALRDLAQAGEERLEKMTGSGLPRDPVVQILAAIETVLASWHSPRAREFRRHNAMNDTMRLSVLLQTMVFGTSVGGPGSGVAFTRNPATGEDGLYADFLFNAQGDDVASGRTRVPGTTLLPSILPHVWKNLEDAKYRLEREFRDMQDLEFTVEDGRLYFLQTRSGHRTPWAALRIAVDLVDAEILDPADALARLGPYDIGRIARTRLQPHAGIDPIAAGVPASPGVATGLMVLDPQRAVRLAATTTVILVRPALTTDDFAGLAAAAGTAAVLGGRTSHAAVVARQLGKVCLVGCGDLRIDEQSRSCLVGSRTLREGDAITIDGDNGLIYAGELPIVTERPRHLIERVQSWRSTRVDAPGAGDDVLPRRTPAATR